MALEHEDLRLRHARRSRIRLIDQVINELELLNLAHESVVPVELARRATGFILSSATHSLVLPPERAIPVADWMAALFEVQDTLMVPSGDHVRD
jgi:hypothetical protein